jgi:hypothetical protein
VDSTLIYYPFLVFKGDIIAIRSIGYLKTLDKCRSLQQINNQIKSNEELTSTDNIKNEADFKLSQDCTICLDRLRDTVLIPCGHICLCYSCAKELLEHEGRQCKEGIDFVEKFLINLFRSYLSIINNTY